MQKREPALLAAEVHINNKQGWYWPIPKYNPAEHIGPVLFLTLNQKKPEVEPIKLRAESHLAELTRVSVEIRP